MHRQLLLITVLCLSGNTLFAQPTDTLRRRDPGGWEFMQVRRNGNVINEGNLLNGKPEGVWTEQWDSRGPKEVVTYHQGIKDGVNIRIARDGFTEAMQYYKNGKLEGPSRLYNRGLFIAEES